MAVRSHVCHTWHGSLLFRHEPVQTRSKGRGVQVGTEAADIMQSIAGIPKDRGIRKMMVGIAQRDSAQAPPSLVLVTNEICSRSGLCTIGNGSGVLATVALASQMT